MLPVKIPSYIVLIFFFLTLFSCSSIVKEKNLYDEFIKASYAKDPVTVKTAIELAGVAYLKGCMDSKKLENKKEKSFYQCQEASKKHVKEHIIDILEQPAEKY